jgi:hypothetical protein
VSKEPTVQEQRQIVDYLASPSGLAIFREIEGKDDEYRIMLNIPEEGGTYQVKLPARTIRGMVNTLVDQWQQITEKRQEVSPQKSNKTGAFVDRIMDERPETIKQLAGYRIIDIRVAADQFHASYPDDTPYDLAKTFTDVAPPFPGCIFEFRSPEALNRDGFGDVAVTITAKTLSLEGAEFPDLRESPKWVMYASVIYEFNRKIIAYPFFLRFIVGGDGTIATSGEDGAYCQPAESESDAPEELLAVFPFYRDWFLAPCLFALSLMHCKGVNLRPAPVPHPPSRKRRKQRKNRPHFEYHVIEIRGMRGGLVSTGVAAEAAKKRLHIVRGHFSTYTDKAPLFGKITGRFWMPAHVAGSLSEGVVLSDYRVNPKNEK